MYAVLVKYEKTCEEATAWLLRGEAQAKAYSELCAIIGPHLRQQVRDHYTGEKLKSLVDGSHKEAAKVCRAENGEYDAVDEEQAAHWRKVDALTRSLQADVRTASDSTPDKLRTRVQASKKMRKSEQGENQDKYNKRKKAGQEGGATSPQRDAPSPVLVRPAFVPGSTDRDGVGPARAYACGAVRQVDRHLAGERRRHNGVHARGAERWLSPYAAGTRPDIGRER